MRTVAKGSWRRWAMGLAVVGLALGAWGVLARPSAQADEGGGETEPNQEANIRLIAWGNKEPGSSDDIHSPNEPDDPEYLIIARRVSQSENPEEAFSKIVLRVEFAESNPEGDLSKAAWSVVSEPAGGGASHFTGGGKTAIGQEVSYENAGGLPPGNHCFKCTWDGQKREIEVYIVQATVTRRPQFVFARYYWDMPVTVMYVGLRGSDNAYVVPQSTVKAVCWMKDSSNPGFDGQFAWAPHPKGMVPNEEFDRSDTGNGTSQTYTFLIPEGSWYGIYGSNQEDATDTARLYVANVVAGCPPSRDVVTNDCYLASELCEEPYNFLSDNVDGVPIQDQDEWDLYAGVVKVPTSVPGGNYIRYGSDGSVEGREETPDPGFVEEGDAYKAAWWFSYDRIYSHARLKEYSGPSGYKWKASAAPYEAIGCVGAGYSQRTCPMASGEEGKVWNLDLTSATVPVNANYGFDDGKCLGLHEAVSYERHGPDVRDLAVTSTSVVAIGVAIAIPEPISTAIGIGATLATVWNTFVLRDQYSHGTVSCSMETWVERLEWKATWTPEQFKAMHNGFWAFDGSQGQSILDYPGAYHYPLSTDSYFLKVGDTIIMCLQTSNEVEAESQWIDEFDIRSYLWMTAPFVGSTVKWEFPE